MKRLLACALVALTAANVAAQTDFKSVVPPVPLLLGGASGSPANKIGVQATDALGAGVITWSGIRAQCAPASVGAAGVGFCTYSTMTNATSTVGAAGEHLVGGMLNVVDTTTGRITTYGGELRNDCRSTDVNATHSCVGGSSRTIFSGASIAAGLLVIGQEAFANITTDGSTALNSGTAISLYLPAIVGGGSSTKYAIYAVADPAFLGGGFQTAGTRVASSGLLTVMPGSTVTAAATIAITGNVFHVTGNTNITSISGTGVPTGTCITMIFDGTPTLTDGSNLKMAGNLVATADDTWSGCYDGTNWFEKGRAVN